MNTKKHPQYEQIQRVGRILWGFSLFWLIFNCLGFIFLIATVIVFGVADSSGFSEKMLPYFSQPDLIPDIEATTIEKIVQWDYQAYLDHFWLTLFYIVIGSLYFVVTMVYILKIAAAWKRGDVFGRLPIRCFRILGWLYLIHGIIGLFFGLASSFTVGTDTYKLVYFSFIRDVCFGSFVMNGSGIECGLFILAISWILKYASEMSEEQQLTV